MGEILVPAGRISPSSPPGAGGRGWAKWTQIVLVIYYPCYSSLSVHGGMGHEHGLWAWVWVWVWVWAWAIIPYRAMPLFFRTDFVSGTPYFGAFCLYCVSISLLPGSLLFAPPGSSSIWSSRKKRGRFRGSAPLEKIDLSRDPISCLLVRSSSGFLWKSLILVFVSWLRTFVVFSLSLVFSPTEASKWVLHINIAAAKLPDVHFYREKRKREGRDRAGMRKTRVWTRHWILALLQSGFLGFATSGLIEHFVPFSLICHDLGLCSGLFRRCPFARGGRDYFYWYINYQEGLVRRFLSTLGVLLFFFFWSLISLSSPEKKETRRNKKKRKRNFLAFARPFAPWSSLCLVSY